MTADRDRARAAADAELTRWEKQLRDELARFWSRQEGVVLARLQGTKARKHTRHWNPPGESKIDPFYVVDRTRWMLDALGSITPIADRIYGEVYEHMATKLGQSQAAADARDRLRAVAGSAVERIVRGIASAIDEVHETIEQGEDQGFPMDVVARMVREQYRDKSGIWSARIAGLNVVGMVNEASWLASVDLGSTHKQWLSFHDGRTRATHLEVDGTVESIGDRFQVGAATLLYPGDPTGPLEEIANCRCTLLYSAPEESKRFRPDQPRYPKGHELGGQWLDPGDTALWLAGKPLKDGTTDVDVPANVRGSTAAPHGNTAFSQHDDLTVRTAADMLTPPPDYPYPRVLNAPVATPIPKPRQTKVISFRPGDVVEHEGKLMSVTVNRVAKGETNHELELVDADGEFYELELPPSATLTSIARSPHPTVLAAARRVIAAAAEDRPIPPAPELARELRRRELIETTEYAELLQQIAAEFEQPDRDVTAADLEQWRAEWETEYDPQAEADEMAFAVEDDEFLEGWGTEWYSRPWAVEEPDAPPPPSAPKGPSKLELKLREDYELYLQSQWEAAESATKANLYSKAGKQQLERQLQSGYNGPILNDDSLFRGKLPRKWASEELLDWFDKHGRLTYAQFRAKALHKDDE